MTTAIHPAARKIRPSRLWGLVVAGGCAWVVGYAFNGRLSDWVVYDLVGLDPDSRLRVSAHVFAYGTAKILLMVGGITFIVTLLRSFATIDRALQFLVGASREGLVDVAAT